MSTTIVPQRTLARRSENVRPARIALCRIGKVRNRLMMPVDRSLLSPTAVPTEEVVRFITTSPPIANAL